MRKIKFTIVNKWNKTTLYQCSDGCTTAIFEVERVRDGIGTLLRCDTPFGLYECYNMKVIKHRMIEYLDKIFLEKTSTIQMLRFI